MAKREPTKKLVKKDVKDLKLNKTKQSVVDKVTKSLAKSGQLPWEKPWSGFNLQAPKNGKTNKKYAGINEVNLMLAGRPDSKWMTFVQIKDAGYKLKKGAQAEYITKYRQYDKKTKTDFNPAILKGMSKEEQQKYMKDNVYILSKDYAVFNADDIDGIPREKIKNRAQSWKEKAELAKSIYNNSEAPIVTRLQDRAYYSLGEDKIYLPRKSQFKNEADFYGTAFHEMAHSTGHPKRLNRKMIGKKGSDAYAKEELVAEFGSMFLEPETGVKNTEKQDDQHVAYVKSWSSSIKKDPNYLFDAIKEGAKAADYVMTFNKSNRLKKGIQRKIKEEK